MVNTIKASIILTTYNRSSFLEKAIKSCLSQNTLFPFEIIVVDDNGLNTSQQKETAAVLNIMHPSLKYIPLRTNMGACMARNEGVKHAKGEYIFFLDDDDEYLPLKIERQVSFLNHNNGIDVCVAAFNRIQYETGLIIDAAKANYPKIGSYKNFVIAGNFFTPMLCIRKESFFKTDGFDDIPRFQDRYWMIKALEKGLKVACIDEPLHIMYEHNNGRITNTSIERSKSALEIIRKRVEFNKGLFTSSEWRAYQIRDLRMKGMLYYTSPQYQMRLKAIRYYFQSFSKSFQYEDIIYIIKAMIKIKLL